MDLYSLVGADSHVDPEGTRYFPDPQTGAFHFPDEVSDPIGGFAVRGKKLWETETERADRMHGMELARRRDPATMLSMQEENVALMRRLTELTAALAAGQLGGAPGAPDPAVTELTEQVKALTAKLAEMEAPPASPDGGSEPAASPAAAKAARAPKTAAKASPAAA